MKSSTTSVRIPEDLRVRLESAAHRLNKGRNRIINEALEEYLDRRDRTRLQAEARRQSLLASRTRWKDAKLWERAIAEVWNDG